MAHPKVDGSLASPPELNSKSQQRREVMTRAEANEPLSGDDLQVLFRLSRSPFYVLLKAGAFERFLLQPPIGKYCYSGTKVARYFQGEHVLDPVFGRKRRG